MSDAGTAAAQRNIRLFSGPGGSLFLLCHYQRRAERTLNASFPLASGVNDRAHGRSSGLMVPISVACVPVPCFLYCDYDSPTEVSFPSLLPCAYYRHNASFYYPVQGDGSHSCIRIHCLFSTSSSKWPTWKAFCHGWYWSLLLLQFSCFSFPLHMAGKVTCLVARQNLVPEYKS